MDMEKVTLRNLFIKRMFINFSLWYSSPQCMAEWKNHPLNINRRLCVKIVLISGIISLLVLTLIQPEQKLNTVDISSSSSNITKAKNCFRLDQSIDHANQKIAYLENLIDSELKPTPGESIFFHETSCYKNGLINLNARCSNNINNKLILTTTKFLPSSEVTFHNSNY